MVPLNLIKFTTKKLEILESQNGIYKTNLSLLVFVFYFFTFPLTFITRLNKTRRVTNNNVHWGHNYIGELQMN